MGAVVMAVEVMVAMKEEVAKVEVMEMVGMVVDLVGVAMKEEVAKVEVMEVVVKGEAMGAVVMVVAETEKGVVD